MLTFFFLFLISHIYNKCYIVSNHIIVNDELEEFKVCSITAARVARVARVANTTQKNHKKPPHGF